MAELVDAHVSGACVERHAGSSPVLGTIARDFRFWIAEENGAFTMDDVINGLCEKMVRRHPHVFGDAKAATPEESLELWNEIKRQEKLGKK